MVPQDHRPRTGTNRKRPARVSSGIQRPVRSGHLMKSVRCELRSAKHFKFRGALARATPLGVPSREEKRPFHLSKRTSSYIYRGEMHFDSQKMGKLQGVKGEFKKFFAHAPPLLGTDPAKPRFFGSFRRRSPLCGFRRWPRGWTREERSRACPRPEGSRV